MSRHVIPPGATIGILGGGQLGRMTALAAARLGYSCHVLAPEAESPAGQVARWTRAEYADRDALARFAETVSVVTLEFENVPVATVDFLSSAVPVRPKASVLAVTQDRLAEKQLAQRLGIEVAPFRSVENVDEAVAAFADLGPRAIMKTTRLGYDGRGQRLVTSAEEAATAAMALGPGPLVLEGFVDFSMEISVIAARSASGVIRCYPPVANRHEHQILRSTLAPAPLEPGQAEAAVAIAERIALALEVEGLLAVEMFLRQDGAILVNELAPRPHNSGHWTMDGCAVSQFEQLVRAICDLPLGDTEPLVTTTMENLLGSDAERWQAILAEPGARLHLYGKSESRPGRKMGHVNRLGPLRERP